MDGRIRGWFRDHATSLGFYLYALAVAPPLSRAMKDAMVDSRTILWPGILLLVVLLLEPIGLRWKILFLRRRNNDDSFEPQGSMLAIFSAATIGHMIVTLFLGMMALDAWGVVGVGSEGASNWWGAVIVVLILKEFVELFACGGMSMAPESPGHWKQPAADFLVLAYGCVAYTAWWESLLDLGDLATEGWAMKLALIPLLGMLFMFLYLPMRLPFLLEEYFLQPKAGRKARIWTELAIGAALGFYPAFF